jgi:hypothetical protein
VSELLVDAINQTNSTGQAALEKYAADAGAEPYKAFYETKKGQNGGQSDHD